MLMLSQQAVKSSRSLELRQSLINDKDLTYYLIDQITVQISRMM